MPVGIADCNRDGLAHLGLYEGKAVQSLTSYGDPIGLPQVTENPKTIQIGKCVGKGKGLTLGWGASDGDAACWSVIGVGYRCARRAGDSLQCPLSVRIAGCDRDRFADLCLSKNYGAARCPSNVDTRRLPLVADGA